MTEEMSDFWKAYFDGEVRRAQERQHAKTYEDLDLGARLVRDLRQALRDAGSPTVPIAVAAALQALAEWQESVDGAPS